eukprot:g10192.t1
MFRDPHLRQVDRTGLRSIHRQQSRRRLCVAFLKVIKGGCPGQILELSGDRIVIGRHPNCDVVLDSASVSRHHAQILQSHGHYYLEDLRSRNKTTLNDKDIQKRTEIHENDRLMICDVEFAFYLQRPSEGTDSSVSSGTDVKAGSRLSGQIAAETAPEIAVPQLEIEAEDADDGSSGASSIISTLNAKSASSLRLGVKPETKLRAVLGISNVLAQTLNTDEVLQKTLDGLFKIFPQADEGFVLLKDIEKNKLVVSATKSRLNKGEDSVRVSMTVVKQAMADGQAILSHNAVVDDRFVSSESMSKLQIRSMMCVPLVKIQGESLGVIQIDTKDLKQQFSQDDLDVLVSVASQVTLAVENAHLHQSLLKQRDLERDLEREAAEMELAVQVQLDFLPKVPPEVDGYRFFDFYEAAMHVGGDYFDYIQLSDGRMAVTLGDVAGKGVPAALLMAKLASAARFYLLTSPTISDAVTGLNAEIASSGLGHRFITMVVVVVDPKKHEVTIANAGHMPPILRSRTGEVRELAAEIAGIPLGVLQDQEFETTTLPLQAGDSITMFTDGITEAMNADDSVYGRGHLREFISANSNDPAELIPGILKDIEEFCGGRPQRDDICLVALLAALHDLDKILQTITAGACEALSCERASLYLYDDDQQELYTRVVTELEIEEIRSSIDFGITGWVARRKQVANIPDPRVDARWNSSIDRKTGFQTRNILASPLVSQHDDRLVGVLQLLNKRDGSFDEFDEQLLEAFGQHAATAIERTKLLDEVRQAQELRVAVDMGHAIQASFLPAELPPIDDYELAVWWHPAEKVSGDYYDVVQLPDGRWGLIVADVSGHGVGPALIMASVRAMLRILVERCSDPPTIVSRLARSIAADLQDGRFITFFMIALDPNSDELTFANAGHGPVLHYARDTNTFEHFPTTSLPLGVEADLEFPQHSPFHIDRGDLLLLATDGAIELRNDRDDMFGRERLEQLVHQHRKLNAHDLLAVIRDAIVMDKVTLIRSMNHRMKNHNSASYYALTGHAPPLDDIRLRDTLELFPAYGSVVDKLVTPRDGMPTFVAYPHVIRDGAITPGQHASFLGKAHDPLLVTEDPNDANFKLPELSLPSNLDRGRLENRRALQKLIERQSRLQEFSAKATGLNAYYEKALAMLQSPKVRKAFDLSREPVKLRERYGRTTYGQSLLLARRLVEAGVSFVNVYFSRSIGGQKIGSGGWDTHGFNNTRMYPILKGYHLPVTDRTLPTFLNDLDERGLLDETLVVWMGEFGRTPKINANISRDHWPQCYTALLAGGGVKRGFVYGASDKNAAYPARDGVRPDDLAATVFSLLGIDPETMVLDRLNRPLPIAAGKPVAGVLA